MLGKPGDLVESIQHIKDGAPALPLGSIGIIKEVPYEDSYRIQWISFKMDDGYVWDHKRFRIITHGRKV